jgi:hypothetical protein
VLRYLALVESVASTRPADGAAPATAKS